MSPDNAPVGAHTSLLSPDNVLVGAHTSLLSPDNVPVGAHTSLLSSDNALVGAHTWLLSADNALVEAHTSLLSSDNALVGAYTSLLSADENIKISPFYIIWGCLFEELCLNSLPLNQNNRDMQEIDGLQLDRLSNGAHAEYHHTTLERAKGDSAVSSKCAKYLTPYQAAYDEQNRVYKTSTKNLSTDDIAASDRLRDELYRSFRDAVKAMDGISIPAMAEAAKVLMQLIKDYRIDPQGQLDKETGDLRNFTEDLKNKYADQVAALGLTEVANELEQANEQTATLIKQRDSENKAREVGLLKRARAATDKAYRQLVKMVNALVMVEGEEAYADFVAEQNSLIKRYKQQVLGQTVSPDKEDDEEPEEPATPEITKFYPKENANPDKPLEFPRNKTAVLEGTGLKLVDSPEGKKAQLVLINYVEQRMPHEDSAILLNTDEKIEFTMMYDAAEGQYNFQIETYPNGTEEAVIIKYPETITLV